MKNLILLSAVLASTVFASAAFADQVYAPNYTCAALQQLVAKGGRVEVQMRFGYGVYVADPSQCYQEETVGNGTVFGTQDQSTCNVGYVCDPVYEGGGNG